MMQTTTNRTNLLRALSVLAKLGPNPLLLSPSICKMDLHLTGAKRQERVEIKMSHIW